MGPVVLVALVALVVEAVVEEVPEGLVALEEAQEWEDPCPSLSALQNMVPEKVVLCAWEPWLPMKR